MNIYTLKGKLLEECEKISPDDERIWFTAYCKHCDGDEPDENTEWYFRDHQFQMLQIQTPGTDINEWKPSESAAGADRMYWGIVLLLGGPGAYITKLCHQMIVSNFQTIGGHVLLKCFNYFCQRRGKDGDKTTSDV